MKQRLKEQLAEEYPFLQRVDIGVGDGWFSLLKELCETLLTFVPSEFKVVQIKEKFGGLRFYFELEDYHHYDVTYSSHINYETFREKISEAITIAEDKSTKICEVCGDPGELDNSQFWVKTLCQIHKKERADARR